MDSVTIAYKVLGAVARKNPNKLIYMRTLGFPNSGRKLFEFVGEVGPYRATTAYSEGFFEEKDVEKLKWIAGRIHTELSQRLDWAERGKQKYVEPDSSTKAPNARSSSKRRGTSFANISEVAVPQD